ncbi:MAG: PBP1A family penicillin-binding protein [Holosporaceae bacterium]|jgi:penicillin-binding protein 1A|nr:PBP1A family penicillin-binding protein [Holosporaceae bacterium]
MSLKRIVGRFLCFVMIVALLGLATLLAILYMFSADLPDHTSLKKYVPNMASRVFLEDGSKLCEYSYEKRYFIPVEKIPRNLINAFLSAEDKRFYEHMGIDFISTLRSAWYNLQHLGSGKRPQGASTITQQVARIFLIKTNEVSYIRKIKEAILSFRIELALSKQNILELYLNQIYMGLGAYGVAAAAKVYFDKTVDELTIAECAYLAALAKGANLYHPIKNKNNALERRNWLLGRMQKDCFITRKEAAKAMKEDLLVVAPEKIPNAEYLAEEIRKYLMEKFPSSSLNKDGFIIRATMDIRLQNFAYNALRRGLEKIDRDFGWRGPIGKISGEKSKERISEKLKKIAAPAGSGNCQKAYVIKNHQKQITIITEAGTIEKISSSDIPWIRKAKAGDVILVSDTPNKDGTFDVRQVPLIQGAIIVIEINTGRILAMQGGYDFSISEFNRATQAMRQCGSIFKPFVYLAALENGFSPNSIIDAGSIEVEIDNGSVWKPKNYHGAVLDKITLRRALEKSINTATIRIAYEVGMDKISKIARQFGIFEDMPQYLSYSLGAGETTPLKITTAYAMIANGGKRIVPTLVDYVQDKRGSTIYRRTSASLDSNLPFNSEFPPKLNDSREQIINEQSIFQVISMLEGVVLHGSGASVRVLGIPVAGKTGTSNESRDIWFVGFTPDIAVGVFVGFDDHSLSLGKNATGSSIAAPIFIDFMTQAKNILSPKSFRIPKGIKLRKIDLETGGSPTGAVSIMEAFKDDEYENENLLAPAQRLNTLQKLMGEKIDDYPVGENKIPRENNTTNTKLLFGIY